jgi:hypothetical protein
MDAPMMPSAVNNKRRASGITGSSMLLVVLALVTLAGCGAARSPSTGEAAARTTLEVDNRGFADMNVYVVDGGQRIKLGFAPGNTKTVLTIPARMVGSARSLSFVADPVGSSRVSVSDTIYVQAGDRVTLLIQR